MSPKTRNAASMKAANMLEIFRMIRLEPMTRAEIARRTGLTRAAVTVIVDRMLGDQVLSEKLVAARSGDKIVRLLNIHAARFFFAGVDISRQGYSVGLADLTGQTLDCRNRLFAPDELFEQVASQIRSDLITLVQQGDLQSRLMGIGIGVPGPVDPDMGHVLNPARFPLIWNVNIRQALQTDLPVAMWVENNALARTVYEKHAGLGQDLDLFMVVIVDTGIGSGLYLNGRLYRGNGYAGELGHVSIDRNGPPCACGSRGCLEGYAAIPMLLRRLSEGSGIVAVSWAELVDRAEAGDSACRQALLDEADDLARGLASAVNLLDLEAIILTGDLTYRPERLLAAIRERLEPACIARQAHTIRLEAAQSRPDAGMASAAMVAIDHFLNGHSRWPMQAKNQM